MERKPAVKCILPAPLCHQAVAQTQPSTPDFRGLVLRSPEVWVRASRPTCTQGLHTASPGWKEQSCCLCQKGRRKGFLSPLLNCGLLTGKERRSRCRHRQVLPWVTDGGLAYSLPLVLLCAPEHVQWRRCLWSGRPDEEGLELGLEEQVG